MALAPSTTWNSGDILTAVDLNGAITNILNNANSLISPFTGNVDAARYQITNLGLQTVTSSPTSTSTGRVVYNTGNKQIEVDDGNNIRGLPTILTTATAAGDLIYGASTGNSWSRLAIGTSGQVLTVTTGLLPAWGAEATPYIDPEATVEFYEDFMGLMPYTTGAAGTGFTADKVWNTMSTTGTITLTTAASGNFHGAIFLDPNGVGAVSIQAGSFAAIGSRPWMASQLPTVKVRAQAVNTGGGAGAMLVGLSSGTLLTTAPTNFIGIFSSNSTGAVKGLTISTAGNTLSSTLGVTATGLNSYRFVVSTSQVDFYVNGTLTTSITATIPSTMNLGPAAGWTGTTATDGIILDYYHVTSTR